MNVTFVALGTEQLAISQLSAICKQHGHKVSLAFSAALFHDRYNLEIPFLAKWFDDTHGISSQIKAQCPDVVLFSPLTATYQWSLEVARHVKSFNPHIVTIFGGVHASAVPHLVIKRAEVDIVVTGEGDHVLPQILDNIRLRKFDSPIPNTRFKTAEGKVITGIQQGFIQDLNTLPFYDKHLWDDHVRMGDLYLTMASRGCPYRCTFCFNNFFAKLPQEKSGKYVRLRSPQHMIAELKKATKAYKIRIVDFQDDVFTTSKPWLKEFLELYKKEVNLPYQILTHPKYMDKDVAKWLGDTGCEWVQMGVQSMDEGFKKDSLMRYERSDDIWNALEVMHTNGIRVKVDHMFGLPDEPLDAQRTALNLYTTETPSRIQTFWTCYLPGTQMMQEAIEKGQLTIEQANKIDEGEDFYFYRNADNIKDAGLAEEYLSYEFIFKILPAIPKGLRKKLSPAGIRWLPKALYRPLSMLADIITGFSLRNPEFTAYAYHYLFHMQKVVVRGLTGQNLRATKPLVKE